MRFLEPPYYGLHPNYPCFSYETEFTCRVTGQGLYMPANGNLRQNKEPFLRHVVMPVQTIDVSADSEGKSDG